LWNSTPEIHFKLYLVIDLDIIMVLDLKELTGPGYPSTVLSYYNHSRSDNGYVFSNFAWTIFNTGYKAWC